MFDETVNGPLGTITEDSKYRYYSQVRSISPRQLPPCPCLLLATKGFSGALPRCC